MKIIAKYEKSSPKSKKHNAGKILFHSEEDREQVLSVWRKWLNFSDKSHPYSLPSYDAVQKMRRDTFLQNFSRVGGKEEDDLEQKSEVQKDDMLSQFYRMKEHFQFEIDKRSFIE